MAGCRMYRKEPSEERELCMLCAMRGGWDRCARSRSGDLLARLEALIVSEEEETDGRFGSNP